MDSAIVVHRRPTVAGSQEISNGLFFQDQKHPQRRGHRRCYRSLARSSPNFLKPITAHQRQANSGYSAHRLVKGDCFEQEETMNFWAGMKKCWQPRRRNCLKAFCDAKWQLRKLNDGDDFAVFNFL